MEKQQWLQIVAPSKDKKYGTIHEKCMNKYLEEFDSRPEDYYDKPTTTNKFKK
jgi:hypothetical protein